MSPLPARERDLVFEALGMRQPGLGLGPPAWPYADTSPTAAVVPERHQIRGLPFPISPTVSWQEPLLRSPGVIGAGAIGDREPRGAASPVAPARIELSLAERTSPPEVGFPFSTPTKTAFRADAPEFVPRGELFETPAKEAAEDDFVESRFKMLRVRQALAEESKIPDAGDSPLQVKAKRVQVAEDLRGAGPEPLLLAAQRQARQETFAPGNYAKVPLTPGPQPPKGSEAAPSAKQSTPVPAGFQGKSKGAARGGGRRA